MQPRGKTDIRKLVEHDQLVKRLEESSIEPCCPKAGDNICFRKADPVSGPDADGWVINVNNGGYPDPAFENIEYCPWCGSHLPFFETSNQNQGMSVPEERDDETSIRYYETTLDYQRRRGFLMKNRLPAPWDLPNEFGETPGGICCQRATGSRCYEHSPENWVQREWSWVLK